MNFKYPVSHGPDYSYIEIGAYTLRIPGGLSDKQITELVETLEMLVPTPTIEPREGVWVAFYYDRSGMAIFDKEVDALRYCIDKHYDDVIFWEFGESWQEATTKPKNA